MKGLERSQCALIHWFLPNGLEGVSLCCYTACCLDSGCPIPFVWWHSTAVLAAFLPLPWLQGGHSPGLHHELSSSALHGDISSVHGGLPGLLGSHGLHGGISSSALHGDLSSVHGASLGCWGLLGMSIHQLLGLVLLGLDLSDCAGLAHHESFSPSMADFFPEMKFKASLSAMSQFAVLALTQSSKVLKEINLLFISSMVLQEVALLTSCSVLRRNPFPPRLTHGLGRSLSASIFSMSLTLLALSISLVTLMPSTPGVLKGVNLCLSHSLSPGVLAGIFKGVSVHVSQVTLMPSTPRVLKWVNLCCSLLPHVSLAGVLKGVSVHVDIAVVLKGLRCNSLVPQLFCHLLKGISGAGICLIFYRGNRLRNIFA